MFHVAIEVIFLCIDLQQTNKPKNLLWVWRSISEGLHGEFAQRAEHQKGIFLQDVRETGGIVGSLQGLSILRQMKKVKSYFLCQQQSLFSRRLLQLSSNKGCYRESFLPTTIKIYSDSPLGRERRQCTSFYTHWHRYSQREISLSLF